MSPLEQFRRPSEPVDHQQPVSMQSSQPGNERHERWFRTDLLQPHLKSKSIRGGAFMLLATIANLVLTLASTSVLARILAPADFGLLGMVFALTVIAEQFKDIGLGRATVQKRILTHSEVSNLFWLNFAFGVGICITISLLSGVIAKFYHEQRLTHVAMLLSVTFAFGGLVIQHQALLNRQMKFFATATVSTVSLAVSNLLAIILALKGFGYWSLVAREIARSMLVAIGILIACPWVPRLPDLERGVWPQIRFGRDITIFNIVVYLTGNLDQILLGRFGGAGVLGVYRQAFQLVTLPINQLISPITSVLEPLFSALQDDPAKYRRGFQKAVSTLSLITMPLAAGIFICSKELVALLLGQRWAGAVDVVKILAVAMFIKPAFSAVGFVMVTCGKTGRYVAAGVLDSIALVAAVSVGVMWGARGVALGHVVATYIVFLPIVWWTLKDTPVGSRIWLKGIARPAVCSLFMVIVLYLLSSIIPFHNNFAVLSSYASAGVVCYLAAMLAIPGGKCVLQELRGDIQSAIAAKRKLRETAPQ